MTINIPAQYVVDYAAAYGEMLITLDENNQPRSAEPEEIRQAIIRREKQILRDYLHRKAVKAVAPPDDVPIT
jgi:hypothetical protein